MSQNEEVSELSERVFLKLRTNRLRLVLAESCTAGLIAAELGHLPGVSEVLAGSFVVYQIESKIRWLQINSSTIDRYGVVSREVAEAMATGALQMSPHADVSLSVTGHVGPNAPEELDGVVWVSVADSQGLESRRFQVGPLFGSDETGRLSERSREVIAIRTSRQVRVVFHCLTFLDEFILRNRMQGESSEC
ncbi:MAG: CinA family protein [Planctomyces sp.]|nr:CinA family protein [Planctomyces sp.]